MADQKVTHQDVEKYVTELPTSIIDRLPDNTETRSARRNLKIAADYLHETVEKVRRERA